MLAGPLRLQSTLLLGGVLDNSLHFLETLLRALLEATASRGTEFPGLLGTGSDGGVLLHILLGDVAHFLWPLGAVGGGGVTRGVVLALLFHNCLTLDNIVLDVVNLLLGPTLGLILGPADLRALDVAVLHKRGATDLSGLVEGDLLVFDEAALPEVLVTVLLLLGLILGHIGGVTPPIVRVVTLDNLVILGLFDHLHLVDAPLAIVARPGRSHGGEAHVSVVTTLSLVP